MDWISVKDKLPKKGTAVLVFDGRRIHTVTPHGFYNPTHWVKANQYGDYVNINVTHWQPLPKPPKED